MSRPYRHVVVVDRDPVALGAMVRALRTAGYHTSAAPSFEDARQQMALDPPNLLVAAAHLGRYHGLHLAVVGAAQCREMKTVILGDRPDAVLEREVIGFGAVFLVKPIPDRPLVAGVAALIGPPTSPAASPSPLSFVGSDRRQGDRRRVVVPWPVERRMTDRRKPPQ